MTIPIIDIFAGPGGLGEGFFAQESSKGKRVFEIRLSIEKEKYAHQTLRLRSFFRQFGIGSVPKEYYMALRREISFEELFELYPTESKKAKNEAWKATLGDVAIREIDERIKKSLCGAEHWALIGGPPCQAYSLVGRSRNRGIDPADPRVYLYREYYRILAFHSPPVFIMENVKGLLSAQVEENKIFHQILNDLRDPSKAFEKLNGRPEALLDCPGYSIYSLVAPPRSFELDGRPVFKHRDYLIRAEQHGIPQARHRVILLGIRKDLHVTPSTLEFQDPVPVNDVLADLPNLRSGVSRQNDSLPVWKSRVSKAMGKRVLSNISSAQIDEIHRTLQSVSKADLNRGGEFVRSSASGVAYRPSWFFDPSLNGVCNHSTRSHIPTDLARYLFASTYGKVHGRSPRLRDFPRSLLPNHSNVEEAVGSSKFADRFRVQLGDEPAKTITSHISKDGHYYIHPDPVQCRSLTVREAARIQTFPDNYFFMGPRTAQYIQVGNAVPPLLAYGVAGVVADVFRKLKQRKK